MTQVLAAVPIASRTCCPICGVAHTRHFLNSNDREVLECGQCGLLFSSPRPSHEQIRNFFQTDYIPDEHRAQDLLAQPRRPTLRLEASIVRRYRPEGGRLLDIGSAEGAFLREFANSPEWSVHGIEPSQFASRLARERDGLDVRTGFLRDLNLPSNDYDVITSLDTFYFHPEPREDLVEISRLIRPGGLLFVEIPGLRFRLLKNTGLICRLLYGVEARLNAQLHLYFYSTKTLTRLVESTSFALVGRYPQQGPIYGNTLLRLCNRAYFTVFGALYRLTKGTVNVAPKELLVYRSIKPEC